MGRAVLTGAALVASAPVVLRAAAPLVADRRVVADYRSRSAGVMGIWSVQRARLIVRSCLAATYE